MGIKKTLYAMLTAALVATQLYTVTPYVSVPVVEAATGKNLKNAKTLPVDNTVTGKLSGSTSTLVYKYTAPGSGYVSFGMERKKVENTVEPVWKLSVVDGTGSSISEDHGTTFSSQPVMVKQDTLYYVLVEDYSHSEGEDFILSSAFTECGRVVSEPDDEVDEAVTIDSDGTYLGIIDTTRDKDYIRVTAADRGYVRLDFTKYKSTSTLSPSWKLGFFDSELNSLFTIRSEYVQDSLNSEGIYVALPDDGSFYIEIANAHNAAGVMYSLKAHFVANDLVEKEPNNSFSHANTVKKNKTYRGSLAESKTGDYYKLKATASGEYVVKLNLTNEVSKGYKVTVYDKNKKELVSKRDITENGKLRFSAKKGKTYYVVVEHVSLYESSYNALYKLNIKKK